MITERGNFDLKPQRVPRAESWWKMFNTPRGVQIGTLGQFGCTETPTFTTVKAMIRVSDSFRVKSSTSMEIHPNPLLSVSVHPNSTKLCSNPFEFIWPKKRIIIVKGALAAVWAFAAALFDFSYQKLSSWPKIQKH